MKSCEEVSKLISEKQDHDLKNTHKLSILTHLLYCRNCRQFRNQVITLSKISKAFNKDN